MNLTLRHLVLLAVATAAPAVAADPAGSGFYGGISHRESGSVQGIAIGEAGNPGRFTSPLDDVRGSQAVVFGGYRWRNDVALEAAVASAADGYRLSGRGGVGLMVPAGAEPVSRAWNLDLYGSWGFLRRFSLYGRLGYSQAEDPTPYRTTLAWAPVDRRSRDGLSYGLGLRYDVNRSFGLKVEYARVGAHAIESGSLALPDADQVQFGLQFRF